MPTAYLLTGMPGSGKTSIIREAVSRFTGTAGGFYTEEIRINGVRQGFRIVTLDGRTGLLAHTTIRSPHRVGKYGVDIGVLENPGVESLRQAFRDCEVVVVDEIGRMELFSAAFKEAVREIIESGRRVLGTIMLKSDPWADTIKTNPRVKLLMVTRNNHPRVSAEIQSWLKGYGD